MYDLSQNRLVVVVVVFSLVFEDGKCQALQDLALNWPQKTSFSSRHIVAD